MNALLSTWEWNSSGPITWRRCAAAVVVAAARGRPRTGWSRRAPRRPRRRGSRGRRWPRRSAEIAVGDVGGDVHLLLAGPEAVAAVGGECGHSSSPVAADSHAYRAPRVPSLARVRAGAGERVVAVAEQRPGRPRLGEDEERQHHDLGVPEHVPAIALAGQRLRADVDGRVVRVRGDQQVVDAEPDRLREPVVADDLGIARRPTAASHAARAPGDAARRSRVGRPARARPRVAARPRRTRHRCRGGCAPRPPCPAAPSRRRARPFSVTRSLRCSARAVHRRSGGTVTCAATANSTSTRCPSCERAASPSSPAHRRRLLRRCWLRAHFVPALGVKRVPARVDRQRLQVAAVAVDPGDDLQPARRGSAASTVDAQRARCRARAMLAVRRLSHRGSAGPRRPRTRSIATARRGGGRGRARARRPCRCRHRAASPSTYTAVSSQSGALTRSITNASCAS